MSSPSSDDLSELVDDAIAASPLDANTEQSHTSDEDDATTSSLKSDGKIRIPLKIRLSDRSLVLLRHRNHRAGVGPIRTLGACVLKRKPEAKKKLAPLEYIGMTVEGTSDSQFHLNAARSKSEAGFTHALAGRRVNTKQTHFVGCRHSGSLVLIPVKAEFACDMKVVKRPKPPVDSPHVRGGAKRPVKTQSVPEHDQRLLEQLFFNIKGDVIPGSREPNEAAAPPIAPDQAPKAFLVKRNPKFVLPQRHIPIEVGNKHFTAFDSPLELARHAFSSVGETQLS